jgi:DNA mismatch repair ATPase MutL
MSESRDNRKPSQPSDPLAETEMEKRLREERELEQQWSMPAVEPTPRPLKATKRPLKGGLDGQL